MTEGQIVGRRQKLRRMEVLRAAEKEKRTREWFEGRGPESDKDRQDRGQATRDLLEMVLLEKDDFYPRAGHPNPYCLTAQGRAFLKDVISKIGKGNSIDWKRIKEIEFPAPESPLHEQDT